ncbi:AsmA family protein [Chelativorans xinjiangense]|uniref:AsmA family protein n=1 Tax=Chelativorans xinjiangense TaxID=2681485 RepID=UPI0013585AB6|nr:AsmA family protein [Chelativorans xinjiangense]
MRTSIFIVLAIAAVAAAALIAILPHASAQFAEGRIASLIHASTGENVRIHGNTTVAVLPFPTVTMEDVEVRENGRPDEPPRFTITSLSASLRVLPLLGGRIEPRSLTLDDARIRLNWNASGEDPRKLLSRLAGYAQHPLFANAGDGGIGEVVLRNGAIRLEDDGTGRAEEITGINMKFARRAIEPFVELAGSLEWRRRRIDVSAGLDDPQSILTKGSQGHLTIAARPAVLSAGALDFLDLWSGPHRPRRAITLLEPDHAVGPLSIAGIFKATEGDTVALEDATFELPGMSASGSLAFGWGGERPRLDGALEVDELDLGPYLRALLPEKLAELLRLPAVPRQLRGIDIDLTAGAPASSFGLFSVASPTVRFRNRAGRMSVALEEAELAGGRVQGTLLVTPVAAGASVRFASRVDGVSVSDIGRALWPETISLPIGQDHPPEGVITAATELTGQGKTLGAVIASLDGWGVAVVRDGSLDGADIVSTLQRLASGTVNLGTGKPFIPAAGRTSFSTLIASANVRDGVVHVPRVRFEGDRFEISLSGRGKLVDGEVEAKGTASLHAADAPARLRIPLVELPFGVGGTVREPMIAPGIPRIGARSASFSANDIIPTEKPGTD